MYVCVAGLEECLSKLKMEIRHVEVGVPQVICRRLSHPPWEETGMGHPMKSDMSGVCVLYKGDLKQADQI